jgi:hypothetical protein
MKTAAFIADVFLFLFTFFVLLTDGFPKETAYIIFTVWILLTLILSSYIFSRNLSSVPAIFKTAAVIFNFVFLAFVCWSLADQYPHPEEPGFLPFFVLMIAAPVLNLLVLLYSRKDVWRIFHLKNRPI